MEEEYVETSDQDELEESRALIYNPLQRRTEPVFKRRKTSHVPSSQTPETDIPILFDDSISSRADTPLTFPPSDGEEEDKRGEQDDLSQDPLNIIDYPSPRDAPLQSHHPGTSDDLLIFDFDNEPRTPSPSFHPPSPPPPAQATHTPSPLPPSPPPQPVQSSSVDEDLARSLQHASGRRLRERLPQQKNPYSYDKAQYARQMKDLKDAYLSAREIEKSRQEEREHRRRDGYELDGNEESQYRPPSDLEQEESQVPPRSIQQHHSPDNDIVPPLPESSDNEEMREVRREALNLKKAQRQKELEQKRAAKEAKKKQKQKEGKLNKFPVREQDQARREGSKRADLTRAPSPEPGPSSGARQTHDNVAESPEQWIDDVDLGGTEDIDFAGPPPPSSRTSQSRFTSRPRSPSQNEHTDSDPEPDLSHDESSSSSNVNLHTEKKRKKQFKVLGRMMPRFLLNALGIDQEKAQRKDKGKKRQQIDPDEQSVRPGQAKARLRTRSGILMNEIRGDTESEESEREKQDDQPRERSPTPTSHPEPHPLWSLSPPPDPIRDIPSLEKRPSSSSASKKTTTVIEFFSSESASSQSSSDNSSSSSEESDAVDDEDIADFLRWDEDESASTSNWARPVRNEILIDYMLARSVRIGSSRKGKIRKQSGAGKSTTRTTSAGNKNGVGSHRTYTKSKSNSGTRSRAKSLKLVAGGSKSSKHRIDVIRPGQGGGKQSLLSFQNHRVRTADNYPIADGDEDVRMFSPEPDSDDVDTSEQDQPSSKSEKLTWKQKRKKRKEAEHLQGVYTHVADPGTRIVDNAGATGRDAAGPSMGMKTTRKKTKGSNSRKVERKRQKEKRRNFTLDPNDKELRQLLIPPRPLPLPKSSSTPRTHPQTPSISTLTRLKRKLDFSDDEAADTTPRRQTTDLTSDFELLPPGLTFSSSTYVRRGLLYELMRLVQDTPPLGSAEDTPHQFHRPSLSYMVPDHPNLIISLSKPVDDFLRDLPTICRLLGELITGLPDADDETTLKEWDTVMRGIEEVLTGFLEGKGQGEDGVITETTRAKIQHAIQCAVGSLLSQMREAGLARPMLDISTLNVSWFLVEMLARAGLRPRSESKSMLLEACQLLVQYLLEADPGVTNALTLLRDSQERGAGDRMMERVAELWVCLIHLLRPMDATSHHLLWGIVEEEVTHRVSTAGFWSALVDDSVWQTIANVCALSQFSEHGLCKEKPMLPAHWKLVEIALQQLNLQTHINPGCSFRTLELRDNYLARIIKRCFLLATQWGWSLVESTKVLAILTKIFSSRKYRDLETRRGDFPHFLTTHQWESCYEYSKGDTAFALLLKLTIQRGYLIKQSGEPDLVIERQLKKLLGSITPLSTVPVFTEANPPKENEVSMLYNRMAVIAVSFHLLPSEYKSKIQQARRYFSFKESEVSSRLACIRSLVYLSQMVILEKLHLADTEVKTWYKEIADVLVAEYKELRDGGSQERFNRVRFLVLQAVRSITNILFAFNDPTLQGQYPDSSLLDVIHRFDVEDDPLVAFEIRKVIWTFLSLRDKVVPLPKRSSVETTSTSMAHEDQDSQDYYGDATDFDFDDPAVMALLNGPLEAEDSLKPKSADIEAQDQVAGKRLLPLTWLLYRLMNRSLEKRKVTRPSLQYMDKVDQWIDTWLHCASVAVKHSQGLRWLTLIQSFKTACEDQSKNGWKISTQWRRRINVRVAFDILSRDPTSYADTEVQEFFIQTFFDALVPADTKEHDFVSLLLSVDGLRHPLLKNLPVVLPRYPDSLTLTSSEFAQLREPLIEGVLHNIEHILSDEIGRKRNLDLLARYLSTMKDAWTNLPPNSKERQEYEDKCKPLLAVIFERHPRIVIASPERFNNWDVWRKGMD